MAVDLIMGDHSEDEIEVDASAPAELEPPLASWDSLCNALPSVEEEEMYSFQGSEDSETENEELASLRPISIQIPECVLVSPRSCYDGFEPPCPAMSERAALKMLLPKRSDEDEYLDLQLDDFTVYCDTDLYPEEMRSLNQLGTESNSPDLYFDGILSNGAKSTYVRRIRIHTMPLGNYGQASKDQTRDNVWLQSELNDGSDVYYKLGTPAAEYKRFFEPFLWVADLAKHVVDFLTAMYTNRQQVTIHHFRQEFASWLLAAYSASDNFEDVEIWMSKYPRLDYRSAVNTNIAFLLLVHLVKNSNICQPCEIVETEQQYGRIRYTFRKFPRRHAIDSTARDAPPNELLYTEETVKTSPSRIVGRCHVRWFPATEIIPTPYNRDGVGAFFFLTCKKQRTDDGFAIHPLAEAPPSLKQGYDPRQGSVPKLRGLDLFCGGGNFGRGLEEGGSVMMKWANDMDSKALHTYMANTTEREQVSPFLGSIDDFQRLAIQGRFTKNIPRVGEVDFISGGSPCPGFSLMTNDKTTYPQRKNQSLVAAFASCVDVYRPKYGILENVVGIIQKHRNRDQDVFSQLMCALVGMGYQARLFFLDAISCGSAQVRSRVFIVFAAPGWALPETPLQTHSHPPSVKNLGLGLLPTGEPMARRVMAQSTPFSYKNAAQAVAGLPKIYDAKPDICVPFPDHRVVSHTNTKTIRNRVRLIPKSPYGMNFSQAWYGYHGTKPRAAGRGILTGSERDMFPLRRKAMSTSILTNSYGRQAPNRPMSTIVTKSSPRDAKQGRTIHWSEDRCLSVMEAKRGQGFLDEEILLGPAATQYKIIGNSVAREVSLALGAVITDAVMRSYGRSFQDLAMDKDDEKMVESLPFWEAPCRGSKLETPETSVPVSPERKENGSSKKRRRLE
ncbi:DNA methyltransferase Dim-2 [Akanthomyces lecanii RCEF 1005]|uniref:DNA (cytosine-5-)-methyltransferase n=1 Tax=Akanthomyces lecanii RCEF 1005 TaxID=1081108 RepID=A0A162KMY1_CORDF|nr:DNA methyltransferase Dim-2 [Akanthomyces lecanii RCEF 1005]